MHNSSNRLTDTVLIQIIFMCGLLREDESKMYLFISLHLLLCRKLKFITHKLYTDKTVFNIEFKFSLSINLRAQWLLKNLFEARNH